MDTVLVFDGSMMSVWVYPQRRLIHHQLKSYGFGDELRTGLTKGTEAMELHGATKWLSDNRLHGPLSPDDELWASTTWFPRTKAAGWKHWAMVQPRGVLSQTNLTRIINRYAALGINARAFVELDEAIQWIDAA